MARPRSDDVLWSSSDGGVYVRPRGGSFSVFDARGGRRRETARRDLGDAIDHARRIAGEPPPKPRVPTLAEIADHYFVHGVPIWHDTGEPALSAGWLDSLRALVRNWYGPWLSTRVDELPGDFITRAELAARAAGCGLSTQSKVAGAGRRLVEYAKALGHIPADARFPRPLQRVRERKVRRKGQQRTVKHHDLPSLAEVLRFARAFAEHTGRPDLRLFWWVAFFMGPRSGELCALQPGDLIRRDGRTWLSITRKVARRTRTLPERIEPYTKGYEHRDVVVPRFLEGSLWAQRELAVANGWEHLFAPWSRRVRHPWISLATLHDTWVTVGADIGWEVVTWTREGTYPQRARGTQVTYRPRPCSLEYNPHRARAFAATIMHAERRGLAVYGMGMSVEAIAKQLGDIPDTVRAHYLGIIADADTYLARVVPCDSSGRSPHMEPTNDTTTTALDRPFLTMAEAGAMVGRSAEWVRRTLRCTPGAPAPIVLRSPGDVHGERRRHELVDRQEWVGWVRAQTERVVDLDAGPAIAQPRPTLPAGLRPASQRRTRRAR